MSVVNLGRIQVRQRLDWEAFVVYDIQRKYYLGGNFIFLP